MTRYVIGPDVALRLASEGVTPPPEHDLLAPTLLRSQVLAELFRAVARGDLDRREANRRLDHIRGLRVRLLGDRVLQREAWTVAERLGWADTYQAEYVALTRLQAHALVTTDEELAGAVRDLVRVESFDVLRPQADRGGPA